MSTFKRNRKKERLSQANTIKQREENSKKFDKAMNDHLEACKIIKRDYPNYDKMDSENRIKLYSEIYNKLHNE